MCLCCLCCLFVCLGTWTSCGALGAPFCHLGVSSGRLGSVGSVVAGFVAVWFISTITIGTAAALTVVINTGKSSGTVVGVVGAGCCAYECFYAMLCVVFCCVVLYYVCHYCELCLVVSLLLHSK